MKKLYLLILISLFFGCGDSSEDPSPATTDPDLYLKSVTTYISTYQYGKPSSHKTEWESSVFNQEGNIISKTYRTSYELDPDRSFTITEQYTYLNGRISEKTVSSLLGSTKRHVYSYSGDQLTEIKIYGRDGLSEIKEYEYSGSAKPTKMISKSSAADKYPTIHEYTYDGRGNMIAEDVTYTRDNAGGKKMWEYDSKNNVTKVTYLSKDKVEPVIYKLSEYKYVGDRIKEHEFSTLGTLDFQKHLYHYDEEGKISTIDVFEETDLDSRNYEQKAVITHKYNYEEK